MLTMGGMNNAAARGNEKGRNTGRTQTAFIWIVFALLIISSLIASVLILRGKLEGQARDALVSAQKTVEATIKESETMLCVSALFLEELLIRNETEETIRAYLATTFQDIRDSGLHNESFYGVYGVFAPFGGKLIGSGTRTIPDNFDYTDRPWYTAAIRADGAMVLTNPYKDAISGKFAITYSIQMSDREGGLLGVLALDVFTDDLEDMILKLGQSNGGFGILADSGQNYFIHPKEEYRGQRMDMTNESLAGVEDDFSQTNEIPKRRGRNYEGRLSVIFMRKMENGWYLGYVIPFSGYYGSIFFMAVALLILGSLSAAGLSAVLKRITVARDKANDNNREMAHWYGSLLDSLPFAVISQDMDMKWTFINKSCENLIGGKREDLIGLPCNTAGTPICNTGNCPIARAQGGQFRTFTHFQGFTCQVDTKIITDINGHEIGYIEVIQDITEKETLLRRQVEAESANKAKTKFLATISHEIRTPMNSILGVIEMQMRKDTLPPDTRQAHEIIYASGNTLLGIVNDLLDLSKIEEGKIEIIPGPYDVARLISETVQINAPHIGSKPIVFSLRADPSLPSELCGDSLRIGQILNNMLSNAFKYTKKGRVSLSVEADCYADAAGNKVTLIFTVEDTGVGMTPEQVETLFDEYTRFNAETNGAAQGAGLGMSITKHLVDVMGGEISVESEPGKGTVLTVRLPQERIGSGEIGRETADSLSLFRIDVLRTNKAQLAYEPMPYASVLLVDDVETNLYVAEGLLSPYQLKVDTLLSGAKAVERIRSGASYDVIFMDHTMPDMDGIEAAGLIRELGYKRPIVALTANALSGQARMFLENGFDDYLSKPIDTRKMDAILKKLINRPPVKTAPLQKEPQTADGPVHLPTPNMSAAFARDAKKALPVLEAAQANEYRWDMQKYIVCIHAMKSALLNIGETELSDTAKKMEQAAREGNTVLLTKETPPFLDALRALIEKTEPKEADGEMTDIDRGFLREKLRVIRAAALEYDSRSVHTALLELEVRKWPRETLELLERIRVYILNSDFAEIADAIIANEQT
ncbi:MAG: response regulator [Oscillospiraceae bacterium]|jgi:PAS domain S-box-containing protein|nr:response regulator [Oscillospiraceae bacterium]